jgi:hypothetical protein
MEELRSTDTLDREILEDARKKAYRLLAAAAETVKAAEEEEETKIKEALAELRERFERYDEEIQREILARIPLDKRRIHTEWVEASLKSAMKTYLGGLSRERLLSLLEGELALRLRHCPEAAEGGDRPFPVAYRGLSREEAEGILRRVWPGKSWVLEASTGSLARGDFPALVADAPPVRITASVDALAEELLRDRRVEMAAALLGKGALDD